jgi:superfamily II DNA or RNA helicase
MERETIQTEAHAESVKHARCSLEVSMRVGKTRIGLMNLQSRWFPRIRALVVAPNKPIFKSWKDEVDKMGIPQIGECIKYSTYRSLPKLNPGDYDIVYLDEYQAILPVHEKFLAPYKGMILGLTGTGPKEYTTKGKLIAKYCPVVYRYTVNSAVNDGILNNYRVFIHLLDLETRKIYKQTSKHGGHWWSSEREVYDYWNDKVEYAINAFDKYQANIMLLKHMKSFPTKMEYAKLLMEYIKHKVIVFANTKEQADEICQYSYHSGNPESKDNLQLFIDDIITKMSCVMQLSAGVTIYGLKACVIMHAYANNNQLAQRLARCLGLESDEVADIHILGYRDTVDIPWILNALEGLDQNKIRYIESNTVLKKISATA